MKYLQSYTSFINEAENPGKSINLDFITKLNSMTVGQLEKIPLKAVAAKLTELLKDFGAGDNISFDGKELKNVKLDTIFSDGKVGDIGLGMINAIPDKEWHATSAPIQILAGGKELAKISLGQFFDQLLRSKIGTDGKGIKKTIAQVLSNKSTFEQAITNNWEKTYATVTGADPVSSQNLANALNKTVGNYAPAGFEIK